MLKEDMFENLIVIADKTSFLLKGLFKIDEGLNLDNIMNAVSVARLDVELVVFCLIKTSLGRSRERL